MKSLPRRRFISALALSLPATAVAADNETVSDYSWEDEPITKGTFHEETSDDTPPELSLTVSLEQLNPEEIQHAESKPPTYRGRELPYEVGNYPTMIEEFTFIWAETAIPIPANLWKDIGGIVMHRLTTKRPNEISIKQASWDLAEEQLCRPRIYKSADGGTALIEWHRPEE